MNICAKCGRLLPDGTMFCGVCGTPVNQASPQQPAESPNAGNTAPQAVPQTPHAAQQPQAAQQQPQAPYAAQQPQAAQQQPQAPYAAQQPKAAQQQPQAPYVPPQPQAPYVPPQPQAGPMPQPQQTANAPLVCAKCGNLIPSSTMKFCPNCGQRVGEKAHIKAPDDWVAGQLNRLVGGTDQVDVRFSDFFTDVPKHHNREDAEAVFACGTANTTPPLEAIVTTWPKPWIYSRVLAVLAITFIGCVAMFLGMGSPLAFPGIIFVGSMMVPFATVIFFFETNVPRNISISQTVQVFFVGGVTSILAVGIIGVFIPSGAGDLIPSMLTGVLEELAKILIIVYYMKRHTGRDYVLNGLLIGATVGAGFATFESAGYAFYYFLISFVDGLMRTAGSEALGFSAGFISAMTVIILRGFLAIGGHVAWAAAEGAALALAEGDDGFKATQLGDKRFLVISLISIVLHGLWDAELPLLDWVVIPFTGGITIKYILLIAIIWIVIGVLLHRGLAQINLLANKARRRALRQRKRA